MNIFFFMFLRHALAKGVQETVDASLLLGVCTGVCHSLGHGGPVGAPLEPLFWGEWCGFEQCCASLQFSMWRVAPFATPTIPFISPFALTPLHLPLH